MGRTILLTAALSARRRPRREPGLLFVLLFWGLVALAIWLKWR